MKQVDSDSRINTDENLNKAQSLFSSDDSTKLIARLEHSIEMTRRLDADKQRRN